MVEERIQSLLYNIKEHCPNIGPVPCFMDDKRAILQVHFRYDSEPLPKNNKEEHEVKGSEYDPEYNDDGYEYDDEDELMGDGHGYNHMFLHVLDLEESDWSAAEKEIIDKYNRCMSRQK